jgi:cytolysin-activating lysine-acyltransferase
MQAGPSNYQRSYSAALGFVLQLLFDTTRKTFSIAAILRQVVPALQLKQIEFCFDARGNPVGYATWAYLTDEVAENICRDDRKLLHLSEWNEGTHIWIIDFVAPYGQAHILARQMRRGRLAAAGRIRAVRRNADGSLRRLADLHLSPSATHGMRDDMKVRK